MKKFFSFKNLTVLCFLLLLSIMFVLGIRTCCYGGYQMLQTWRSSGEIATSTMENVYNDGLPGKYFFLDLNGGFQRLMGIRSINERYQLDNGYLTYIIPETDVTGIAENTISFRDKLDALDIPFAYINTPFLIDPEDKQLPISVEDYSNENADCFLSILKENGVNTLDLRELEKAQGLDHYSLYFRTDHHWKAETGFWAYQQIVDWLARQDASYTVDPVLTDPENYSYTTYENIFMGSSGRRIGKLYAGMDDLTVISPKFESSLRFEAPFYDLLREGSYEETLLFPKYLSGGKDHETNRYNVYCGDEYPELYITNSSRQKDLPVQSQPKRLLILKDSYSSVVIPYLALSYDELCFIDMRLFGQDLMTFIEDYQPDMVITLYNPGALEWHNHNMFPG